LRELAALAFISALSKMGGLDMADGGGGGAGMGIVVGALIVIVAIIAVVVFANGGLHTSKSVDVNVHAPSMPAAAPATR
jgi:hypothetical protein